MAGDSHIIKTSEISPMARGGGIVSTPLITVHGAPEARITTGMSVFPPGAGAPRHIHNCDEQVTLLAGRAEVEIEGERTMLEPFDSTYIPAGRMHSFRNVGVEPMRILWIYAAAHVTRTLEGSDVAVEHLSPADRLG